MTTVMMILILLQLMQTAPVLDQTPMDPQAGAVDDALYAVSFLPDGQGADIQVPPVLGRSPMYSTESLGKGQFLLQFESLSEQGTIHCRYDLLDIHRQSLTKLYEATSNKQGTYALGAYDTARSQLIHSFFAESVEIVGSDSDVRMRTEEHSWFALSPNKHWLVIQKGLDQGYTTALVDLWALTSVECPEISQKEYIFHGFVANFSPDSTRFYSMPRIFGDTINIFDSASGTVAEAVTLKDTLLTSPVWSPTGDQLAFLIESLSESMIQEETTNLPVVFSKRIGINDFSNNALSEFVIPTGYAVEAPVFNSDGRFIFVKTASEEVCKIWSAGGEGREAQPVTLNVLDIGKGTLTPLVKDFKEGIQGGFSSYIQGIHYGESEALLFRQTSETAFDLYRLNVETGEEKTVMRFQSMPSFKIVGDALIITGLDGMYRMPLDGSGSPEWMGGDGMISPDGEAIYREFPNENGSIFSIRLMP